MYFRAKVWTRIIVLGTIGGAFSSCGSENPPEEVSVVMDGPSGQPQGQPEPPWPRGLSARFELTMPGRTEGVIIADGDQDGELEILATCRAGSGGGAALRSFGANLEIEVTVSVPDWPLAPVAMGSSAGGNFAPIAVASRSSQEVLVFDLTRPAGEQLIQRMKLSGRPLAMAAGPYLFQSPANPASHMATLAIATRTGDLLLFPVKNDPSAPLEAPLTVPLQETLTSFLALEASMVLVGSMGAGAEGGDSLRRYMVSGPNTLAPGEPETLAGIPRDWLLTPAAELLAGGDQNIWNHDGSTWNDLFEAGRAPLRLLGLGGERFASVSGDLSVRVFGMQGLEQAFYGGQDTWDIAGGDLDGDGLTDLVLANRGAERVSVLFSSAQGSWRRPRSLPTGIAPLVLVAADFSGSGQSDLLTVDASTDGLSFFRNQDGDFIPMEQPSPGRGITAGIASDFNGDGALDLVTRAAGEVRVQTGNGEGKLSSPVSISVPGTGPLLAGAGNLLAAGSAGLYLLAPGEEPQLTPLADPCTALTNLGDGRILVGVAGARTGLVVLNGALQEETFLALPGKVLGVAASQLDPSGPVQILALLQGARDNSPGKLVRLMPDPSGTYAMAQEQAVGLRPHALALGDMNGDGRQEVVISAQNSHHVNLFSWNQEGTLTRLPDLGAGRGPLDVTFIPSPDGTTDATLVIGCNFSNEILLIRN